MEPFPPQPVPADDPATADPAEGYGTADPATDAAAFLPPAEYLELRDGRRVRLRPIMTLEVFALVDIVATGLGPALAGMSIDPDEDERAFIARMAGMTLAALPKAGPQVVAFLRSSVEPADLIKAPPGVRLHPQDKARNTALTAELDQALANPDPMDTVTLIEGIWDSQGPDLWALGKRVAGTITKLRSKNLLRGATPASRTSPA